MRSPADATPAFVHLPELAGPGQRLELSGDDAHYVTRVCRARAGDTLAASNGRGLVARLRLTAIAPIVLAEVLEIEHRDSRGAPAWVMTGEPEGQRADWMVEKLAELGIARWQPLSCARSPWQASTAKVDRWGRLAIAALRQSRSAWRMEVQAPIDLAQALATLPDEAHRWLADPDGEPSQGLSAGAQIVAVGPAAGFDDRERDLLERAGFRRVCLAPNRLRTETAAVAWAASQAAACLMRGGR